MRNRTQGWIGALAAASISTWAVAQDDVEPGSEDNGFLVRLIEDQLSTETRKIRLSGVEGVLSSAANIRRITISDPDGVWLQIENAVIDWNRSALLRGALDINTLAAERILLPRGPAPDQQAVPDPEARDLSVPELPVSVSLDTLNIGEVVLGEDLAGLPATLAVQGSLDIADGAIDVELGIDRLDATGGRFDLTLDYANQTERLDLNLALQEPADGVVANLLDIEGRPSVAMSIEAAGQITDLTAAIDLVADGRDLVDGTITVRQDGDDRIFGVDITGEIQPLVDPAVRAFFADESVVQASVRVAESGAVDVTDVMVESAGLSLDGALSITSDGFLSDLRLQGLVADKQGGRMVLPSSGGTADVERMALQVSYGSGDRWSGRFQIDDLRSGEIRVRQAEVNMGGAAENLADPARRRITADITGAATGLSSDDPAVALALGERLDLTVTTDWRSDQPLELRALRISGNGVEIETDGTLDALVYTGTARARVADLSPMAQLSGRGLSGAIDVEVSGSVSPLTGAFDLDLDGLARDLVLDVGSLDPLLRGETTLSGGLSRGAGGLRAREFALANDQAVIRADGSYGSDFTDFDLNAEVADLGLVAGETRGRAVLDLGLTGDRSRLDIALELEMPEGSLAGRDIRNGRLGFRGTGRNLSQLTGRIDSGGTVGGAPLTLEGQVELSDEVQFLRDFRFVLDRTRVRGNLGRGADGLISGSVDIRSSDISTAAALFLTEAVGAVDAQLVLSRQQGMQRAGLVGTIEGLSVADLSIEDLDVAMILSDVLGVPLADGTLSARGVTAGGFALTQAEIRTARQDASMTLTAAAELQTGTKAEILGRLDRLQGGFGVALDRLEVANGDTRAALQTPARLEILGSDITLSGLDMAVGDGALRAEGEVSNALDVTVNMDSLPLSIGDLIMPDLGLVGIINGSARITGARQDPQVNAELEMRQVGSGYLQDLGVPPLDLTAIARTDADTLSVNGNLSSAQGLSAELEASVPFNPAQPDLRASVAVRQFEMVILDRLAGRPGLGGRANGTVEVAGSVSDPTARFDLDASGLTATLLRENGILPLDLSASGQYRQQTVLLDGLTLSGSGGLGLRARGQIPLAAPGLAVAVHGTVPLALANTALAASQVQVAGRLDLSGNVTGRLTSPELSGEFSLRDGTAVSGRANFRMDQITVDARLAGDRLTLGRATGRVQSGGTISAEGNVVLSPQNGLPADVRVTLDRVRYSDGELLTTGFSGQLTFQGPLQGAGELGGVIDIGKTEIVVPKRFGINQGILLDVDHRNPPRDVQLTLDRAGLSGPGAERQLPAANPTLNLRINAPNQVFIRGRGLDAEMGGRVDVRGTLSEPSPIGRIDLIRGRLGLLGQRIEFDQGSVTLLGNLDPAILLVAETESSEGTVVIVRVEGSASAPEITFSSQPPLPQDEVLALLIFDRNVAELSPFQLAQLASAAATLAGSGGNGVVDQFRSGLGLANLDVTTDEEGEIGVRAGAYINENIYLDVETAAQGKSKATINLDITDTVRARASVDSDGESEIGIFYERDY